MSSSKLFSGTNLTLQSSQPSLRRRQPDVDDVVECKQTQGCVRGNGGKHMCARGETTCNHDNLHGRRSAVRGSRNEHKSWPFAQNVKGVCLNPRRNQRLHPGTSLIQTICHPLRFISVAVSEGVKALNVRFQFDSRLPDDGWSNPPHMATLFCFEIVCFLSKLLLLPLLLLLLWRRCVRECCDSIGVLRWQSDGRPAPVLSRSGSRWRPSITAAFLRHSHVIEETVMSDLCWQLCYEVCRCKVSGGAAKEFPHFIDLGGRRSGRGNLCRRDCNQTHNPAGFHTT